MAGKATVSILGLQSQSWGTFSAACQAGPSGGFGLAQALQTGFNGRYRCNYSAV